MAPDAPLDPAEFAPDPDADSARLGAEAETSDAPEAEASGPTLGTPEEAAEAYGVPLPDEPAPSGGDVEATAEGDVSGEDEPAAD